MVVTYTDRQLEALQDVVHTLQEQHQTVQSLLGSASTDDAAVADDATEVVTCSASDNNNTPTTTRTTNANNQQSFSTWTPSNLQHLQRKPLQLHISLSRTLYFKLHHIPGVVEQLERAMSAERAFKVAFTGLSAYSNDERSRSFLGHDVSYGKEKV
jgi:hypothetical protein